MWDIAEPLIPKFAARRQGGGTAPVDDRAVFTAIVFVLTSGCAWRQLPPAFGVSVPTAHRWWRVRRAVRYEPYGPPIAEGAATDIRSITLWHRDQQGWPIGKVSYLICHQCRIGYIGNLDVQKNLWGNGIATEVLAHLRRRLPGYTWQTSRRYLTAKSFWLLITERIGEGYTDTDAGYVCSHMARFWSSGPTWATKITRQ